MSSNTNIKISNFLFNQNTLFLILFGLLSSYNGLGQNIGWYTKGDVGVPGSGNVSPAGIVSDTLSNTYVIENFKTIDKPAIFGNSVRNDSNARVGCIASKNDTGGTRWVNWIGATNCNVRMQDIVHKNNFIYVVASYIGVGIKVDTHNLASAYTATGAGLVIIKYNLNGGVVDMINGKTNTSYFGEYFKLEIDNNGNGVLLSDPNNFLVLGGDSIHKKNNQLKWHYFLSKFSFDGDSILWSKEMGSRYTFSNFSAPKFLIDDSSHIHLMGNSRSDIFFDNDTIKGKTQWGTEGYILQLDQNAKITKKNNLWERTNYHTFLYEGSNKYVLGVSLWNGAVVKFGNLSIPNIYPSTLVLTKYDATLDSVVHFTTMGTNKVSQFGFLDKSTKGDYYITFGAYRSVYYPTDTVILPSLYEETMYFSLIDSTFKKKWGTSVVLGNGGAPNQLSYLTRHVTQDSKNNLVFQFVKSLPILVGNNLLLQTTLGQTTPIIIASITDCSDADSAMLASYTDQLLCNKSSITFKSLNKTGKYQWTYNGLPIGLANDSIYKAKLPGSYNLILDQNGCKDTSLTVKVLAQPSGVVTFPNLTEQCSNDTSLTLNQATPKGGIYKGYGVVQDSIFKRSITGKGIFPITYVYVDSNSCKDSVTQNIKVGGTSLVFTSLPSLCSNASPITLNQGIPTGGSYHGTGVSSGSFNPSVAGLGSHNIKYTYQSGTCFDTAFQTIIVDSLPNVSMASINTLCETTFSVPLTQGTPSGGTYISPFAIGTTFYPAISKDGIFNVGYTYSDANGCKDTVSSIIQVDPADTVKLTSLSPICSNSAIDTLRNGAPWGGYYTINGVQDSIVKPSFLGNGSHTIQYKINNTCVVDSATRTLTINTAPTVSLPAFASYCAAADSFAFSGATPSGGSYSLNNKTVVGFSPKTQGTGTYAITYKYSNGNSCQDSSTKNLKVNAQPIVSLSTIPNQCSSSTSYSLIQGSPVGGIYSGTGVTGKTFNANIAGSGTHTLKYVFTDSNSCTDSNTQSVSVFNAPVLSHPNVSAVCAASPVVQLAGALPTGGKYEGLGVDSSGIFTPSSAGAGNNKVYYTYTSVCGKDSVAVNILVNAQPNVTLLALSSVCANGDSVSLSGASPNGGTFSGTSVYGTKFSPAIGAGSYPIKYSFTDTNSCSDSATQTLVVDSVPVVRLANFANVCSNSNAITLTQGTPVGGSYSGTGVTGNTFNPNTSGVGAYAIQYQFTNAKGCADSTNKSIQVDTVPVVSFIAPNNRCEASASVVLNSGTPVGGSYTGTGVYLNSFYPDSAKAGNRTISYSFTDGNNCTATALDSLTVYGQPNVTLSALSSICANSDSVNLTGANPTGGAFSGTSVYGTKFNPSIGAGSYSITYSFTDSNSCSDSATQTVVVDSVPNVTLANLPNVCANSSAITLTQGTPVGGSYSGTGVTGNTFNPNTSGVGAYAIQYQFTNAKGCADSTSATIQVDTVPVVTFIAPNNRCETSSAVVLNSGKPTGGSYSGTGVYLNSFYPDSAKAGNRKITYSFTDGNSCTNTAIDSLMVYAQPKITFNALSSVCANGDSVTLSGVSPIGGTFSGTSVYGSKFNPKIGSGSYIIKYAFTDTNSCSDTASQVLVVDSVPLVTLNSFSNVCANSSAMTLTQGNPLGGTYSGSGVSGFTFTPSTSGLSTLQYKYTNGYGCSDSTSATIQVDSIPIVSFTAPNNRCEASASVVLNTGLPVGGSYSGIGVYLNSFYPDSAKAGRRTITYSFTDGNNCTNTAIDSLTVYAQPNVTFSALSSTCANSDSVLLSGASPSGGTFAGSSVYGSQFNPRIGAGSYRISYSFTDINSCTDSASQTIVVDSVPAVTLSSFGNVCANSGAVTLSHGKPAGGTYSGTGVLGSVFTPSSKGPYSIQYKFTNANGCSDSTSGNLTVDTVPNVTFSLKSRVCKNEKPFALNGLPAGGIYFGTGVSSFNYNPQLTSNNTDTVSYVFTDLNNCSDTVSQVISIDSVPRVMFTPLNGICDNSPSKVINGGSPLGGKYISPFVDTSNSEFPPLASGQGKFNITYVFTDGNNCTDSANSIQEVWPSPKFDLGNDTMICDLQTLRLNPFVDSAKHLWSTGKTTKSITVAQKGTFWVQVTDSNQCMNSDTITVSYEAICVGIEENLRHSFHLKYFPNPSNGMVHVKLIEFPYQNASLNVRNMAGQLLKRLDLEGTLTEYSTSIDLSNFENGLYFLELKSADISITKRVLLNK